MKFWDERMQHKIDPVKPKFNGGNMMFVVFRQLLKFLFYISLFKRLVYNPVFWIMR